MTEAPTDSGEDNDQAEAALAAGRRRLGLVLMLVSPVAVVVGLFGVLMFAVITGFTGAPPDLIGSEPVPVDADDAIVLEGDSPYVVVNDRRAEEPEPLDDDAATEEPVCAVIDPGGHQVDVELAANWDLQGGSPLAQFHTDADGRYEITCEYDGSALPLAVADDGAWQWNQDREAEQRLSVVLAVVVLVASIGLWFVGLQLRRR